jgi:hypothetical protein
MFTKRCTSASSPSTNASGKSQVTPGDSLASDYETFAECSILFMSKEYEEFNHRNILDISRIRIDGFAVCSKADISGGLRFHPVNCPSAPVVEEGGVCGTLGGDTSSNWSSR